MSNFAFRWIAWNLDHATKHGVTVQECESVVRAGRYRNAGNGKYRAVGRGIGERWIQVVFSITEDEDVFVIHARPLTDAEKRQERRRKP